MMNQDTDGKKIRIFDDAIIINIGIEEFYQSLVKQNKKVIHLDWSPENVINDEIDGLLSTFL